MKLKLINYKESDGLVSLTFQNDDGEEISLEFLGRIVPSDKIEGGLEVPPDVMQLSGD